jgi:uncharacterized protein YkwD
VRLALAIAFAAAGVLSAAAPAPAPSAVESALVDLANAERKREGLPPFRSNGRLMRAAQLQAEQVAKAGRLDHTVRGAKYPTLRDRVDAVDYEWTALGENLAYGQRSAAQATGTWMKSAGHRANILNRRFTEIGTAHLVDRRGRPYYVQVFARPAS